MIRRGRLAAFAVVALALVAPAPAAAEAISGPELVALAGRAAHDEAARKQLLTIDEVDGKPVAVGVALAGARGTEIQDRVKLIVELSAAPQEATPAADRARAHDVLDDRRFKGAELPRPLDGPIGWLSDRLAPIIADVNDIGHDIPGGVPVAWTLLALLALLISTMAASTSIRWRARAIERSAAAAVPEADDPAALERAAAAAERDGEWERAVRLRFRAGLLRLDRRKVLVYRPSLTTGEVARTLNTHAFTEVGTRFDEIAYGGRAAERDDAEASERGWKDVLAEVARR